MKKMFKMIIAATLVVFSIQPITSLYAINEANDTAKETEIMIEQFQDLGISKETAEKLAEKVNRGETIDSLNPDLESIDPVLTVESDELIYYLFEYPDGSRVKLSITPEIITGTISGGTQTYGTYWQIWNGAKVSASWGIVTASFYADFQRAVGGGQINSVYDKGIIVTGGTFSDDSLYIVRSNATSSLPAQAQLYFTGTAVNGFGMATFYLRLFVPYNGPAYARFSILN